MRARATLSLEKARSCAIFAGLAFALTARASAAGPPAGCSNDTFAIDGTSVMLELCLREVGGNRTSETVGETVSVRNQAPLEREVVVDRVAGAETSRAIDDVPLGKLGLDRTLHVTIALRGTAVRLEHALLIPGAVALK